MFPCRARSPKGKHEIRWSHGCDWLPTIADFCEASLPRTKLDGKSLKKVILDNNDTPHELLYWRLGGGKRAQWVVRQGDWKLLGNPKDTSHKAELTEDDKLFLVNLANDISELTNVANDHPEIVERLSKVHDEYETELGKLNG